MSDWLVAILARKSAHERLVGDGFSCYRPVYRERRVVRGRRTYVERFLLGSYLLVEMFADWIDQVVRIIRTPGIIGVLMCDERPMVARERQVRELKSREVRGYIELPSKVWFKKNQKVVISRGPFVHCEARYKKSRGVLDIVELKLLGSVRDIVLPEGSLVAA